MPAYDAWYRTVGGPNGCNWVAVGGFDDRVRGGSFVTTFVSTP